MSDGILVAIVTVQITDIISTATPTANAATQIAGSGSSSASASEDTAIDPPLAATNRIGRLGDDFSETRPPAISPVASQAEIRTQADAPPRCAFASAGPSPWNPAYQAASTTV